MKRTTFLAVTFTLLFSLTDAYSQSADFKTGESFFLRNEPEKAITFLKTASSTDAEAFILLSLAYYQLGQYDEGISVCEKAMENPLADKKILSYNAGNMAFAKEDFRQAERWFSISIKEDESFFQAYLNRANTRLKTGNHQGAKTDYETYLELNPETEQKDSIIEVLALLNEIILQETIAQEEQDEQWLKEEEEKLSSIKDEAPTESAEEKWLREEEEKLSSIKDEPLAESEEEKWLREEEEKISSIKDEDKSVPEPETPWADEEWMKEEEEKIFAMEENERKIREAELKAEEERRIAEEEKRKREILENVAASLQNTNEGNMSAEAEGTIGYEFETELE